MSYRTPFRLEVLKQKHWPLKFAADAVITILAVAAVVLQGVESDGLDQCGPNETKGTPTYDACVHLTWFTYLCFFISCMFLSIALVRSNELVWTAREAITNGKGIHFLTESSTLTPNAFSLMLFETPIPNYLARVLISLLNGPRFVALPVELLYHGHKTSKEEWLQWLSFVPSIILAFTLYVLLYVLLQQSGSVLNVLFSTVSLQIFAELSPHFAMVAFDRAKSAGETLSSYSSPTSGFDKIVEYTMQRLTIARAVNINMDLSIFRHYLRANNQNELLVIVAGCLNLLHHRYKGKVTVEFSNYTIPLFKEHNLAGVKLLFAALNRFEMSVLALGQTDLANMNDQEFVKYNKEMKPRNIKFELGHCETVDSSRSDSFLDSDDESSVGFAGNIV